MTKCQQFLKAYTGTSLNKINFLNNESNYRFISLLIEISKHIPQLTTKKSYQNKEVEEIEVLSYILKLVRDEGVSVAVKRAEIKKLAKGAMYYTLRICSYKAKLKNLFFGTPFTYSDFTLPTDYTTSVTDSNNTSYFPSYAIVLKEKDMIAWKITNPPVYKSSGFIGKSNKKYELKLNNTTVIAGDNFLNLKFNKRKKCLSFVNNQRELEKFLSLSVNKDSYFIFLLTQFNTYKLNLNQFTSSDTVISYARNEVGIIDNLLCKSGRTYSVTKFNLTEVVKKVTYRRIWYDSNSFYSLYKVPTKQKNTCFMCGASIKGTICRGCIVHRLGKYFRGLIPKETLIDFCKEFGTKGKCNYKYKGTNYLISIDSYKKLSIRLDTSSLDLFTYTGELNNKTI